MLYPDENPNYLTLLSQKLRVELLVLVSLLPERFFTDYSFDEKNAIYRELWRAMQNGERSVITLANMVLLRIGEHELSIAQEGEAHDDRG